MLCPRCQKENPPGRGFCVHCAYPLPDEPAKPSDYEPIRSWEPVPNAAVNPDSPTNSYYPQNMPQTPRRRPIVLGIIGFALSLELIGFAFYDFTMRYPEMTFNGMYSFDSNFEGLFLIIFNLIGITMGVLSLIFSIKALRRFDAAPQQYMGRGMYKVGLILSIIALAVCALFLIGGIAKVL